MSLAINPLRWTIPSPLARPMPRPIDLDLDLIFFGNFVDPLSRVKALDESGRGNHGTIDGATWLVNGLSFDWTNDNVKITAPGMLAYSQGTVVLTWKQDDTSAKFSYVFGAFDDASNYHRMFFTTGGKLKSNMRVGGTNYDTILSAGAYDDNLPHCLVLTHDGTTSTMYIDGVAEADTETGGYWWDSFAAEPDIFLGAYNATNEGGGTLYHASIYSRAFTPNEIKAYCDFWMVRLW